MPDTTPCKRSSERRPKRQLEIEYGPEQPGSKMNQRDPERMSEEMPHRSSERLPESLHKMAKYVPRLGRGPRTGYPKTMRSKKLQGAVHSYPKPPWSSWWWVVQGRDLVLAPVKRALFSIEISSVLVPWILGYLCFPLSCWKHLVAFGKILGNSWEASKQPQKGISGFGAGPCKTNIF